MGEPKLNVECSLEVETVKPNSGFLIDNSNSGKKNLDRTFSSEVDECRRNIEHIQNDFFSPEKSETDNDCQVLCKETDQDYFEPEENHSEESSNSFNVERCET